MKTSMFFKTIIPLMVLSMACVITSCDKDDDDIDDETYAISGSASGSREVPAVATSATGTLSGSYNARTNLLTYNINWTGLSGNVVVAHFHGPAAAGVSADPIHDISIMVNGMTGSTNASVTLADSTESHLLNGKLYYNLHTALHPGGEIRGQVSATPN